MEHVGAGGVDRRLGRDQAHRREREADEHERRVVEDERQHEQRERQQPGAGGDEDPPGAEAAERQVVGQPAGEQHAGQAAEGEQDDRGGRLRERHVVVAHEERRRPRADAPEEQRADPRRHRDQHERADVEHLAVGVSGPTSCRASMLGRGVGSSCCWIRSCWPRTGSGRRRARIATMNAGMPRK